jgi:5-methylcytosine-specific restriction endonuclease McrA
MSEITSKRCTKCGEEKQVSEFYLNRGYGDGYNPHCKSCWRIYLDANREKRRLKQEEYNRTHREEYKEYREVNKERIAKRKAEYVKANQDKIKSKSKIYREANKQKFAEYLKLPKRKETAKRWREKNQDKLKENVRRYRERHPGITGVHSQNHLARAAANGGSFTLEEWQALCELYGNRCLACGESKPLTVDHVIPRFKGGTNDISNLQPLCRNCNSRKGTKTTDYRPKKSMG